MRQEIKVGHNLDILDLEEKNVNACELMKIMNTM
mgnify:CR=1 FL=1